MVDSGWMGQGKHPQHALDGSAVWSVQKDARSCTVMKKTTDCIALSLTLPKSH